MPTVGASLHARARRLFVLLGSGLGLARAAMANEIVAAVPASWTSVATGLNSIMRQIGASIGTAIVGAVLFSNVGARGIPTNDAFTTGFWVIAAALIVALMSAMLVPGRRSQIASESEAVR